MSSLVYYEDFYGWTQEQAKLLRKYRINELDLENHPKQDRFCIPVLNVSGKDGHNPLYLASYRLDC